MPNWDDPVSDRLPQPEAAERLLTEVSPFARGESENEVRVFFVNVADVPDAQMPPWLSP